MGRKVMDAEFEALDAAGEIGAGDVFTASYYGTIVSYMTAWEKQVPKREPDYSVGVGTDKDWSFDFVLNAPDTEYLIFITKDRATGKLYIGYDGMTCIEIKDGYVTIPITGETKSVDEMK